MTAKNRSDDSSKARAEDKITASESRSGPDRRVGGWIAVLATVPALALLVVFAVGLARSLDRSRRWPCKALTLERVKHGSLSGVSLDRLSWSSGSGPVRSGPFSMAKLKGKTVMVNFWLTSCQPCVREMPSLLELGERAGKRMTLLLVATDEKLEDLKQFYKTRPRFWPHAGEALILWDPGGKLAKSLGTQKYPETYFLDRNLKPLHRAVSLRDWTGRSARRCVAYLARK